MAELVTRVLDVRIQVRNDSAANWAAVNPTMLKGEIGVEIDTGLFKFGDGITPWNGLPYGAQPALKLAANPGASDWDYQVGTMAVVGGDKAWILVSNAQNAAVWKRIMTTEDIIDLGVGDMLKSAFATNEKVTEGYVDSAIKADKLTEGRDITLAGDVISAAVEFDGTQNIILNAALAEVASLAGGGTFTKVQVNAKGQVVGYEVLLASDIPDLTLAKITDAGTAADKNVGTAAGQVVMVDEDGKIDGSIIPALAITDVFIVNDIDAMLEISGAEKGDIAILKTPGDKIGNTFILAGTDPTERNDWVQIVTPLNGIQIINDKSGHEVTLNTDDIDEGDENLYFTEERVVDVMRANASSILTDGASIMHDTDILILNGGNAALTS